MIQGRTRPCACKNIEVRESSQPASETFPKREPGRTRQRFWAVWGNDLKLGPACGWWLWLHSVWLCFFWDDRRWKTAGVF
jgi:hypothetical protein